MESGVVFWVFVVLVHPVTVSPPYATQAACEVARHRVELRNTTGCHLEPIASLASERGPVRKLRPAGSLDPGRP